MPRREHAFEKIKLQAVDEQEKSYGTFVKAMAAATKAAVAPVAEKVSSC